ncbi:MAG: hypothetical protein [Olavius algarvensis Gamma 1 endosymbiont]|nr:MAG: hypothetical protein [Olavius algarvensis Gamma 1 endosymbiont]
MIRQEVTEYRIVGGTCACGHMHSSAFPEGMTAPVRYGSQVSAPAVYLTPIPMGLDNFRGDFLSVK